MKLFLALALRNLFRNRLRTAVSLLSIAFGCAALIVNSGVVFNIFRELREDAIHGRHGHLQIYRRGYTAGHMVDPERYMIARSEADQILQIARKDPHVVRATRRREFSGLASNGGHQAPFIGIGVEADDDYEFSKHTVLVAGSQLSANTGYGILAGKGLAEKLNCHPGDDLSLVSTTSSSQMNTVHVRVEGIFEGGLKEYDDWTMKMPIPVANQLLLDDRTEQIVLLLDSTAEVKAVETELQKAFRDAGLDLETRSWNQLALFHNQVVSLFGRELDVIALIVGTIVILGISNVVGMSIMERRVELATFRALGVRPRALAALLLTESGFAGLIGALIGVLLAIGIARVATAIGIPYPSPPGSTRPFRGGVDLVASALFSSFAISVAATVAAALLPVWRAVRVSIADTLRKS
jgi:putative ABC transport system permease protein